VGRPPCLAHIRRTVRIALHRPSTPGDDDSITTRIPRRVQCCTGVWVMMVLGVLPRAMQTTMASRTRYAPAPPPTQLGTMVHVRERTACRTARGTPKNGRTERVLERAENSHPVSACNNRVLGVLGENSACPLPPKMAWTDTWRICRRTSTPSTVTSTCSGTVTRHGIRQRSFIPGLKSTRSMAIRRCVAKSSAVTNWTGSKSGTRSITIPFAQVRFPQHVSTSAPPPPPKPKTKMTSRPHDLMIS
jgi:hypothetical protein